MAASLGFGNWQQAIDEATKKWERRRKNLYELFQELKTNDSRVAFIFKHNLLRDVSWLPTYFDACKLWHGKSTVEAAFWKTKGNNFFQHRKFSLAVDAYTQSCLNAPASGDDLSLSLGNRSAALFHLSQYKPCVRDIDRAISLNFPPASRHKLLARKTMVLIKLDQKAEAVKSEIWNKADPLLKRTEFGLQVLKDFVKSPLFSLEGQKKDLFMKELDAMERSVNNLTERLSVWKNVDPMAVQAKVYRGLNTVLSQASQCVSLTYTPEKGRHLLAIEAIPRGSTLMVERPFCAVLLPNHYETHCHHCFSSLPLNCIGCKRCTSVRFCNESCRDAGWSQYHSTECPYLDLLHSVGIAHLSLRVVLCAGLSFLKDFLARQSEYRLSPEPESLGLNAEGRYDREYLTVFDLMTHEDDTEPTDMLQYSMTAGLLLLTLAHAGFFSSPDAQGDSLDKRFDLPQLVLGAAGAPKDGIELPSDLCQVGGLLLRHILQLVCNAHAITSIQAESTPSAVADESDVSGTEQSRIATAIYPTASLMNHSCDRTIVSSFVGDTLIVRTVKDVAQGEEVYNCYGPHYCRMDRQERQAVLLSQYHFMCDCSACHGEGVDHRRFGAFKCPRCAGVLSAEGCLECGDTPDSAAMASLKQRAEEAQKLFENAVGLMNAQHYQAASTVLERCRDQRQEFLYKDHRDLALVQDAMARCCACQGDFCTAADHLDASVEFARLLFGSDSPEYGHELHKQAEVLFHAGRVRECAGMAERCLRVLSDLYPPGQQVLREVTELHEMAQKALIPQVNPR